MKKKWLAAALAGILLAAAVLSGCASTEKAKRLRFGVAGEGGIYREFGERFAALENETDNGQVELKATAGSAANLRLLTGEYLQLAIAQADLVQDAYDQTDSDIRSIEDLHGRTVSIGAEESGSEQNALQILSAYGLNDKMVSMVNLNYEDAAAQLKAGRVDAIFMTVGAPSPVLTALAGECGIRLLKVDGAAAQRLMSAYSAYNTVTLSAGTYPGQTEEVQTVGVKAVLLASNALPAKQVQQLTQLLFSSREGLEEQLGIPLDPEENAVEGVGIPFHAGAAAYYKAAGITVDQTAGN